MEELVQKLKNLVVNFIKEKAKKSFCLVKTVLTRKERNRTIKFYFLKRLITIQHFHSTQLTCCNSYSLLLYQPLICSSAVHYNFSYFVSIGSLFFFVKMKILYYIYCFVTRKCLKKMIFVPFKLNSLFYNFL